MLSNGFCREGKNENTREFAGCGDDGVYGGGQCVCAAGGTSGECAAGPVAGGESGERVCESGSGAIREEHGGGSRSDAGGEVWLQAFARDEFVRAPGDAHRAIEQYVLCEDFRADGAGREDCGDGCEGQAGGGGEGLLCVLHGGAGEGGRFETGGAIRVVRQPADFAGRGAGGAGWQLDGPLCDAGDLFAVERDFAADGATREVATRIRDASFGSSVRIRVAALGGGRAFELASFAAVMQKQMDQEHYDEDAAKRDNDGGARGQVDLGGEIDAESGN